MHIISPAHSFKTQRLDDYTQQKKPAAQVAAPLPGGIFTENTENNQFSPSNSYAEIGFMQSPKVTFNMARNILPPRCCQRLSTQLHS